MPTIRLGTRASALARWQADWVSAQLRKQGVEVELVLITTSGDQQQDLTGNITGQGIFTKEIQNALLDNRIDLAVHSLKDLPTLAVPGLCLAAVPERASSEDALISAAGTPLEQLPKGATIGTGSLRRRAQLLHYRADLKMRDLRGNVDTRLRKLREGEFDAIVLAVAGLTRLGFDGQITQRIPAHIVLPAVGQGALGLETREDDPATRVVVASLDHPPTHAAVLAERAMLAKLQGGCTAPVAGFAHTDGKHLFLKGRAIRPDGAEMIEATLMAPVGEAESLGRQVAEMLLAQGAAAMIRPT